MSSIDTGRGGPGALSENQRKCPLSKPLHILVVEDHADTAKIMGMLLRMNGHTVKLARGVVQAAGLAADGPFDLMLCDLGLPDGSGLDLMRDLKRRYGMDGFALSGSAGESDREDCLAAGFLAHLSKPISPEVLETMIGRFADRRTAPEAAEVAVP